MHLFLYGFFFLMIRPPPRSTPFPYTTLFRSVPADRVPRSCVVPAMPYQWQVRRDAYGLRLVPHHQLQQHDEPEPQGGGRSEEHTSELQSRENLVCRLLLEKKKKKQQTSHTQQ